MTVPSRVPFRIGITLAATVGLVLGFIQPAVPAVVAGANDSTLLREAMQTPEALGDGLLDGLQFADPTSQLAGIDPPEASSGGSAALSYPLVFPKGRGITPELELEYDSGGGSSWVGQGWSFGVGEMTVDTTYGVPLFCPRSSAPACGDYESESYRINGDLLVPSATRSDRQKRVPDRQDFTRKVETEYDHIIRHGDSPEDYSWEVRDKMGNIFWYGMYPDSGGPHGDPGDWEGPLTNDESIARSAILADDAGNGFTWYLKAQRDVGVNTIRYEYDTVYYKAGENDDGVTWTKVADQDACGEVCGRHVYLSRIYYTGGAQVDGDEENPDDPALTQEDAAYEVRFIRGKNRQDPIVSARGGFLDVDRELLTRVEVSFLDDDTPGNTQDSLAVAYDLDLGTGPFGKTILKSVTQVGCATGTTCDTSTSATHTFDYYDDVDPEQGFTEPVSWTTQNDALEQLEGHEGALGMSKTNGGDGHIYIGFNPTNPTKTGSFGGSLTFDGATTESLAEFMDINGDNLPDKVYAEGSGFKYRLNTSSPENLLTHPVTFSEEHTVDGLVDLPKEHQFGVTGGIEAYFGVVGMFNVGGSWNWSDGYFTDANGDGLPDFARGGSVWFNHLVCTGAADASSCVPTFSRDDTTSTRLPLDVADLDAPVDDTLQQTLEMLRKLSPPIDTVRRWVAPYAGRVRVTSEAVLQPHSGAGTPSECTGNGVRVAVQLEDIELDSCVLTGAGQSRTFVQEVDVAKGSRLYFRLGPDPDQPGSEVAWDPSVDYLSYADAPQGFTPEQDENGLSQQGFGAGDDFTLAGRPGGFVGMPKGGAAKFAGELVKAPTSDDIRPSVTHQFADPAKATVSETVTITAINADGSVDAGRQRDVHDNGSGEWCFRVGSTDITCHADKSVADAHLALLHTFEQGKYRLESQLTVDAPPTSPSGNPTGQDVLEIELQADSPVNPQSLTWATVPEICYTTAGACTEGQARVPAPVDTEVYPLSSSIVPKQSFTPSSSGDYTVVTSFDVAGLDAADDVIVTVKTRDGGLAKHTWRVDASPAAVRRTNSGLTVNLQQGKQYFFDVTVRSMNLFEAMSGGRVQIESVGAEDPALVDVPHSFNATGRQGYFGTGWHGWGVAGYRGDGARRTAPIDQAKFRLTNPDGSAFEDSGDACEALTGGACLTSTDGMTFPGDYSGATPGDPGEFDPASAESQIKEAYAYIPTRTQAAPGAPIDEAWTGPKPTHRGTAAGLQSSRLGEDVPSAEAIAGGLVDPPTLRGQAAPTFALTGGVGPATASFGMAWSDSDVDFMDMNGDGFPDTVQSDSIKFTDPRGGRACPVSEGVVEICAGGGPSAVTEQMTVSVSGGFSGSPVGIKANARGVTNSNQGGAAAKGGSGSKDEYGAGVGAGAGVSLSWSAPVTSNRAYDSSDFEDVPGNGLSGGDGITLQRALADLNGDGLPDQVKTTPDGVFAKLNLGYGFTGQWVKWAGGTGFESGESYGGSLSLGLGFSGPGKDFSGGVSRNAGVDFPRFSWTDVNGDSILDGLYKDGDTIKVAFGTGSGLLGGGKYGDTAQHPFEFAGDFKFGEDEDQIRQDTSYGYGGGLDFTMGFGPLCLVACYLIVNPGAHFESSVSLGDIDMQDVNGDGFADSLSRGEDDETLSVRLNTQGRTGLLKSVRNPLGGSFSVDYERTGNTVTHPGSTWKMSKLTVDDGRDSGSDGPDVTTSTFEYDGLAYDFVNRAELGFSSVTTRELGTDGSVLRTLRNTFSNGHLFEAGLATKVQLYDGDVAPANLVQQSTSTWRVLDGETGEAIDVASMSTDDKLRAWGTPLMSEVHDEWFEGGGGAAQETRSRYTYDPLGNPTRIEDQGDLADPDDDVTADLAYTNCANAVSDEDLRLQCGPDLPQNKPELQPAFWNDQLCPTWTSLPAVITVTDADGAVLRHRDGKQALCDNSSVTLLRELISGTPEDGEFAETELAYDEWGSYDRIVYPEAENGRHYTVQYQYDPTRHSNVADVAEFDLTADQVRALIDCDLTPGQSAGGPADPEDPCTTMSVPADPDAIGLVTTATFDGRAGQVATRTDANGNTTSYDYDALGRVVNVTMPDDGHVDYEYHPGAAGHAWAAASHSDEFNDNPIDTVTFVDGIGRTTQRKQETALFRTGPGGPENGFVVSGAVAYDALGRQAREWQPTFEAKGTMAAFNAGHAATDPILSVYDVLDRTRSRTEVDGRVTTTSYDFVPDLSTTLLEKEVTDPLGRKTATFTDIHGYTRAVDDIAVGRPALRTRYDNDRLGQLLRVTSAGREQLANTYDLLGRRTSTSTQDGGLIEYGYDAVGNQTSKQTARQRDADDSETRYHYAFGNLTGIDHPDDTPDVSMEWGGLLGASTDDNGAGRLVGVTDAAREQVLGYDENGVLDVELTTMTDDHWKRGQVTTTFDHDWLGRLASVGYPDGETVTSDYDLGGQLASVAGAKACTDLGKLFASVDATQTTVTVTENPLQDPPTVPFTVTIGEEQLLVTARAATAAANRFDYTVERGINGIFLFPTSAPHSAGASVTADEPLTCAYRYLDRQEYDLFGNAAFRQVGNGNQTRYLRDERNQRLDRQVTTSPAQGATQLGKLVNAVAAGATTMLVAEDYAPPALPFTATLGTEKVTVTSRTTTATAGRYEYVVTRGAEGSVAAAQPKGTSVHVDREIQNLNYTYDKVGNVTKYVNDLPPDVPSLFGGKSTQTYELDPYYRVVGSRGVWDQAPGVRREYTYDLTFDDVTGNLLSKNQRDWEYKPACKNKCSVFEHPETTFSLANVAYDPDHQHQIASQGEETFTHDLDGNLTSISNPDYLREMTWNADGRMSMIVDRPNGGSGGKPTYLTYDYNGDVGIEEKEQGRTWFVNPWVTVKNGTMLKNVFAGEDRLGVKYSQDDAFEQKVYFLHDDLQGSTNVVSDRKGEIFQHHEYFPNGQVWLKEDSTVFRTPYQFAGEYADEDHTVSDFGQRWFDVRRQSFYGTDQALWDDPTVLLGEPGLQQAYTFANSNPVTYGDPDGRSPVGFTSGTERKQLRNDLRAAGVDDPDLRAKIRGFFAKQTGLGGKIGFTVLSNYARLNKVQEFADRWDMKPLVQFEIDIENGKVSLTSIKFGFGAGPRAKLAFGADDPGGGVPSVPANGLAGGGAQGGLPGAAADVGGAGPPAQQDVQPPAPIDVNPGANGVGTRSDGGN